MPGRKKNTVVIATVQDASLVLTKRWDEARTLLNARAYFEIYVCVCVFVCTKNSHCIPEQLSDI